MNTFNPNRHERIERRKEKKNRTINNQNQPIPHIYAITLFRPKKDDIIKCWHINPKQQQDLEKVANALKKKLSVDLYVVEALLGYGMDVHIRGTGVKWCDVVKYTTEALLELNR